MAVCVTPLRSRLQGQHTHSQPSTCVRRQSYLAPAISQATQFAWPYWYFYRPETRYYHNAPASPRSRAIRVNRRGWSADWNHSCCCRTNWIRARFPVFVVFVAYACSQVLGPTDSSSGSELPPTSVSSTDSPSQTSTNSPTTSDELNSDTESHTSVDTSTAETSRYFFSGLFLFNLFLTMILTVPRR